ncbi:exodeoxyribonuclease III [Streptococcus chenjunshii]|uniref:Exodeoxyribonuclease III n=1 Tax=Streptococcus chenjunshii TaxID=2173853 RepID=A0A372KPC8_9STRE|nr:endonuclease/exonuclease/phosphatase family protein [Streptococcus chenjunshii]AXQ77790.1 exodeoxyribonuclease III [Streptococcus chenjunshii]RFU51300.1 exodeoxyribonuclease III [Streptococcus chenjunshii]RFU53826.1 exodeoxyribonuclease III [Streptococcus chenjunshii]
MAKYLTLNAHSWLEANALKKLFDLAEHIYSENYDLISLQEVNQSLEAPLTENAPGYRKLTDSPPLRKDNFALQLVNYLRSQGRYYYWSWAYNHIGYGKYQEGVAVLSRNPLTVQDILISAAADEKDYHTRRVLLAQTQLYSRKVTVACLHMSWFGKGFEAEWKKLEDALLTYPQPLVLMGDFNNPTNAQGYQMILNSPLRLQDSHNAAEYSAGGHTIIEDIDGWEDNRQALKVDHIFASRDIHFKTSQIVLDGGNSPIVSDHFGLAAEIEI